jgi:hypothetical protein
VSVQRTLGLFGVLVVVPRQDPWRLSEGGAEFERQWLWVCHDIDPVGASSAGRRDHRPGRFSQDGTDTTVITGQMIRLVNAGEVVHQMHFHGNHVWTLRRNWFDFPRRGGIVDADGHVLLQHWEDVVELDPLDRKEIMLPFRPPPEVLDEVWEARTVDWHYPMHCHAEPSQTAAGGLYPGGAVADWVLAVPKQPGGTR